MNINEKEQLDILREINKKKTTSQRKIAKDLGLLDKTININPISSSAYPSIAKRPKYSVLDCSCSFKSISLTNIHWRTALRNLFLEYKKNLAQ